MVSTLRGDGSDLRRIQGAAGDIAGDIAVGIAVDIAGVSCGAVRSRSGCSDQTVAAPPDEARAQ